ncbi:MAG: hypothetical protein AB1435_02765, partial [Chloroflexota bacterium]
MAGSLEFRVWSLETYTSLWQYLYARSAELKTPDSPLPAYTVPRKRGSRKSRSQSPRMLSEST